MVAHTVDLSDAIKSRYHLSDAIILNFDFGVNSLGVSVWRWNSDLEEYETLFDSRLVGYCALCGAKFALANSGFDDPYDLIRDTNLTTIECECD